MCYIIPMREEFHIHNLFKESVDRFLKDDPHLRRARGNPFLYEAALLDNSCLYQPGIFSVTGGRQVGKTTFLKQMIGRLLQRKHVAPSQVFFFAGELINDDYALRLDLQDALESCGGRAYVFIDEVSYVKDWDKAVKFLADAGGLDQVTLILSGSDSNIIRDAMRRFAGRRGRAERVDFIFHPLTFCETVLLKNDAFLGLFERIQKNPLTQEDREFSDAYEGLAGAFRAYLVHGGYLTAMSDLAREGRIAAATFRTYSEWIRGDMLKHHKQEKYLFEILRGITETYLSQVSWNALSKRMSIEHHKTVSDYALLLEDFHVLFILEALAEHKMAAAPKKAKKLYFWDPFIWHAVRNMLRMPDTIEALPALAETTAVSQLRRSFDTYYIKGGKGEVDAAIVDEGRLLPVEIKWTEQLHRNDLKQILSGKRGVIADAGRTVSRLENIIRVPLIKFLIHAESGCICIGEGRNDVFAAQKSSVDKDSPL